MMPPDYFFNRDLSWLSFNARVMEEALNDSVPLIEKIKFLGIFSSNLDEFYRVRMPVLRALQKLDEKENTAVNDSNALTILQQANQTIYAQQVKFGEILSQHILPILRQQHIQLLYNKTIPAALENELTNYFLSDVLAYLQPVVLNEQTSFFPENNQLYLMVQLVENSSTENVVLLNIPSNELPRFYSTKHEENIYVIFLDDIIRNNLDKVFKNKTIKSCYSFKVTRDAELDLQDEYPGDISEEIEKQLTKRDSGLATRFLYQAEMPLRVLELISERLSLQNATLMQGGRYHNLKDFSSFPIHSPQLEFDAWPPVSAAEIKTTSSIASIIAHKDLLVHTPYESYATVLRFFNEAAINPDVEEISVTLYRIASNSKIASALISAAKNGKKVQVVVELKARFDEANNLKWAKKMKQAGVKIIYSITALKVHAKIALVKTRTGNRLIYSGLLATGNLNETTARFYTDHIMLTTRPDLLREMELLFIFLSKREKPLALNFINFGHLLVAQFNLQTQFLTLIDREIANANQSLPASITLKMNNLEEQTLISKLYEASRAGVQISLIIRSICCLVPGVKGMSENITIRRIVDRYLEHGRVFIFHNNGKPDVFLGSADWMNRNIYRRIEVCFPVYDEQLKKELMTIIDFQLHDNTQAVMLNQNIENVKVEKTSPFVQSQQNIYKFLKQ